MKHTYATIISLCLFLCTSSSAQSWTEVGMGVHALNVYNGIYTTCLDPSGNIYAAGMFWDSAVYQHVAKWDGTTWQQLPSTVGSSCFCSEIDALCSDTAGNIYAGGGFVDSTGRCFVAKWDGTSWTALDAGLGYRRGNVLSLVADKHGNLYAAGAFSDSFGHCYVAKWDGHTWSTVGSGSGALNANSAINTIFIDTDDNIYAAGNFTDSGVVDTAGNLYVAMWNGAAWSELGHGVVREWPGGDLQIFSMTKDNEGNVYAGGWFFDNSGQYYVAKWDGSTWSELGGGGGLINNSVYTMCLDGSGQLCVAGVLFDTTTPASYVTNCYVARWDGATWGKLGNGIVGVPGASDIFSLVSDRSGNLYAAGDFVDTSTHIITIDSIISYTDTIVLYPEYVAKYSSLATSVPAVVQTPAADVYPNPANDHVYIEFHSSAFFSQPTRYHLYNCLGQLTMSGSLHGDLTDVNIAGLVPGMYVLKLSGAVNVAYQVVKE